MDDLSNSSVTSAYTNPAIIKNASTNKKNQRERISKINFCTNQPCPTIIFNFADNYEAKGF